MRMLRNTWFCGAASGCCVSVVIITCITSFRHPTFHAAVELATAMLKTALQARPGSFLSHLHVALGYGNNPASTIVPKSCSIKNALRRATGIAMFALRARFGTFIALLQGFIRRRPGPASLKASSTCFYKNDHALRPATGTSTFSRSACLGTFPAQSRVSAGYGTSPASATASTFLSFCCYISKSWKSRCFRCHFCFSALSHSLSWSFHILENVMLFYLLKDFLFWKFVFLMFIKHSFFYIGQVCFHSLCFLYILKFYFYITRRFVSHYFQLKCLFWIQNSTTFIIFCSNV